MVSILSSSEKLNTGWTFTLALFGLGLESSAGGQATDITLDGYKPVLPRAVKTILIVSKGGLEEAFP